MLVNLRCRSTYSPAKQISSWSLHFDSILDDLNLHGNSRQHCLLQTVKFIKTPPSTTFHQSYEDPTHRLHINALKLIKKIFTAFCALITFLYDTFEQIQ